ncbi:type 1 glutamine amidotransferase [Limosilactobacillus reuteri]|uniref:type 1 glutamine amidotransferase n=1 Tax=Limosilactobacillus reuteri TaxID=1598 RepID=UPI001E617AC2|nr:type 1 glutamine amidotransferase [Limosilactobacillus reuteri]MCC4325490.1 type 1 glutamine amidotransferase [Limosilactobacillus reuteri]MCC4329209.1 type 1 glutamine amidotransferase [Limosilactobacillus reuteri]MCC4352702.1 type 1 glutamine amidotransferase [Limosilactobacillus reuteri]MCC4377472.1 type 1 glutamine amidotransferase [Limosilactobacillus reuteri]
MRINVLQHTPNEGPGMIQEWSQDHGHEMYIYHPYQFGNLPTADETDMLIILGGPMSPNDDLTWIKQERVLIQQLIEAHKPIFGACYGAQQIAKTLGYAIKTAPHKEVGWAPVYLKSDIIPNIPEKLTALHWHEEMFEVPEQADLLFSSDLVKNQGFVMNGNVIGLQFHFEPTADNVREIAVNDDQYPLDHNDLHQNGKEIIQHGVPAENKRVMYQLLEFIANN